MFFWQFIFYCVNINRALCKYTVLCEFNVHVWHTSSSWIKHWKCSIYLLALTLLHNTACECCFVCKISSVVQEISRMGDVEGRWRGVEIICICLFLSFPLLLSISDFQTTPHLERQAQQGSRGHIPPLCNSSFGSTMYHYWELHVVICVLWPDVFWGGQEEERLEPNEEL